MPWTRPTNGDWWYFILKNKLFNHSFLSVHTIEWITLLSTPFRLSQWGGHTLHKMLVCSDSNETSPNIHLYNYLNKLMLKITITKITKHNKIRYTQCPSEWYGRHKKKHLSENDLHANKSRLWKLAQNHKTITKRKEKINTHKRNARLAQEDGNSLSTVIVAYSCKMLLMLLHNMHEQLKISTKQIRTFGKFCFVSVIWPGLQTLPSAAVWDCAPK